MNAARNVPTVEIKFEDVENYMVEKAKKESLELTQDSKSKQIKILTQKMSKMEELRQALARLVPPPAPAAVNPPAAVVAPAVNPPIVDAPPINNNNAGGQPLNAARNVPTMEMRFEDMENYMVEKAKKESLELVQDL